MEARRPLYERVADRSGSPTDGRRPDDVADADRPDSRTCAAGEREPAMTDATTDPGRRRRDAVRRRRRAPACSASCPALLGDGARRVARRAPGGAGRRPATPSARTCARTATRRSIAEVPDAEEAKTAQVAAYCWQALGQAGFTRTDVVVGVGGGATTDLAGFVAATWLRGVRGRPGADDAARHGRRGGRRQDRHQHRRGQEPRRRVPPAGRGALRPRRARVAAGTTTSPGWPR